jgi:two-component system chemotaxis response regulator CheB
VIMFSTLTERGASSTLQALAAGANDYVTKPTGQGGRESAMKAVRESLVPLVVHWGRLARRDPPTSRAIEVRQPRARKVEVEAVVIGSSTGGPVALTSIIPGLPANLIAPILVVQHMPAVFTRMLAERLNERSSVGVWEATDGMEVEAGHVYIAPGGRHMAVRRDGVKVGIVLGDGPPENSCKPAADVLFRSAAEVWGAATLALVLTGMGQDGLAGARAVVNAGGTAIVQDEASSVVWGMPGAIAKAGLAEAMVPLGNIANVLQRRVGVRDLAVRRP